MLLLGLDEAGYGPPLGPLCHGVCILRLPGGNLPEGLDVPDLWARWAPLITRMPPRDPRALIADDSKRVYAGPESAKRVRLCLTTCAWRELVGPWPGSLADGLWEDHASLSQPWEQPHAEALVWETRPTLPADLTAARQNLAARWHDEGVALLGLRGHALTPTEFNRAFEGKPGFTKGRLNALRFLSLLETALRRHPGPEPAWAILDRLGGRKFHGDLLAEHWPFEGTVRTLREDAACSTYEMRLAGRLVRLSFQTKADAVSLPTALASLAAKYVRETSLARLNGFFRERLPGLKPTAGYPEDAKRFLRETQVIRRESGIQDKDFVRVR